MCEQAGHLLLPSGGAPVGPQRQASGPSLGCAEGPARASHSQLVSHLQKEDIWIPVTADGLLSPLQRAQSHLPLPGVKVAGACLDLSVQGVHLVWA